MSPTLTVTNERVDDLPLLIAQQQRMGIAELLDKHFATHGNWQGLSLGWLSSVWLSYILSQSDHRLSHVQPWAEKRLETLSTCTGQSLRALDFTDDRLESVLSYLSDEGCWQQFEQELGGNLLQVYELKASRIRLDSTTAPAYCGVNEEGLFQFGYSKDHRPDLAQLKLMLSTLDPLGMPVATEVLAGNKADDPLYCPAINQVRKTLNVRGLLYIGDCKMAAISNRAFLVAGDDYYLCPLSSTQFPSSVFKEVLESGEKNLQELTDIYYDYANGKTAKIAQGFEQEFIVQTELDGIPLIWTERRLFVRSMAAALSGKKSLLTRLKKAQEELDKLKKSPKGKKLKNELNFWQQAAETIVQQYQVQGLLQLSYEVTTHKRVKRGYRGSPARIIQESEIHLTVAINEQALTQAISRLGWRVYVTNQSVEELSLNEAVGVYREQYLIEQGFSRLKGYPLSLTPIYLQRDDYIVGLIRLLSIGLRVLTLLEFDVRRCLAEKNEKLSGIYAGNPKRATTRPSAEQILGAFKDINLILIDVERQIYAHLNPLSPVQNRILALLNFPVDIYTKLGPESS